MLLCAETIHWEFDGCRIHKNQHATIEGNSETMECPKCGSENVETSVIQEVTGSTNESKTQSKYKQVGHGCLWWLTIGWWWWIVDLFLWIFFFLPRLFIKLFQKKKYRGASSTIGHTTNQISYATMCLCKSCGNHWKQK